MAHTFVTHHIIARLYWQVLVGAAHTFKNKFSQFTAYPRHNLHGSHPWKIRLAAARLASQPPSSDFATGINHSFGVLLCNIMKCNRDFTVKNHANPKVMWKNTHYIIPARRLDRLNLRSNRILTQYYTILHIVNISSGKFSSEVSRSKFFYCILRGRTLMFPKLFLQRTTVVGKTLWTPIIQYYITTYDQSMSMRHAITHI